MKFSTSLGTRIRAEQGNEGAVSYWNSTRLYSHLSITASYVNHTHVHLYFASASSSLVSLWLDFSWQGLNHSLERVWEQLCLKGFASTSKRESYLESKVGLTIRIYDANKLIFSKTLVKTVPRWVKVNRTYLISFFIPDYLILSCARTVKKFLDESSQFKFILLQRMWWAPTMDCIVIKFLLSFSQNFLVPSTSWKWTMDYGFDYIFTALRFFS